MWTRILAVLAIFPFALLIALVGALPGQASALAGSPTPGTSIPMPTLQLEWAGGVVVLSGVVPNAAEQQAIKQRAVAIYGSTQVIDRLEVAAVANPRWLSPRFVPDLRPLLNGVASLEDARLVVTGVAPTVHAQEQVAAWLESAGRAGLSTVHRVTYGLSEGQPVALR